MKHSEPFVITITRMLGSGGADIGKKLATELNILYLDREIVSEAAKELYALEEDVAELDERPTSIWQSIFEASAVINETVHIAPRFFVPTDRLVFDSESEIIERTAKERSAVVIGRCGSHVLRNHPRHISIFLNGELAFRRNHVEKLYSLNAKDAIKMVEKSDKIGSNYHKQFTGHELFDLRQYTICLDTSKIGIHECADIILKYAEQKFGVVEV